MKAEINMGGSTAVLKLIPETPEDQKAAAALVKMASRNLLMNFRGHEYLDPNVEFYLQPMPRGD